MLIGSAGHAWPGDDLSKPDGVAVVAHRKLREVR